MSPASEAKRTPAPEDEVLAQLVERALDEDATSSDITTRATVPREAFGRARLIARSEAVVAGLDAFTLAMTTVEPALKVIVEREDGSRVEPGTVVATVEGSLRGILTAERTALNFVQHMSGIATLTRAFVDAAGDVIVKDTRKTTPGVRWLQKRAVRIGGGTNHRADLDAAVLIKDNHLAAAGGVTAAVEGARRLAGERVVQVECDTLEQVTEAVEAGADWVLLDNMDAGMLIKAVAIIDGRCKAEASGGITLEGVAEIAATGVDAISVGALTHSAPAIDFTLEVED